MDSTTNRAIGLINYNFKPNDYAIKCEIYNKLTKMGVVTYKNTWDSEELDLHKLILPICTFELQNKILVMFSNDLIDYNSIEYKYLITIFKILEQS